MKAEKRLILAARAVSLFFTPFYLPIVGMIALFTFSFMSIFPARYKLGVLLTVYLFTVLLPTIAIRIYRRWQGWTRFELGRRERRMVPYALSIASYFACYYLFLRLHMPHFLGSILLAALCVQIVCALINIGWKVSTHSAAIGAVGGALFAFAEYLAFNPVWWLCLVFFVGGIVGTCRMILRQHSLGQIVGGFWTGFFVAAIVILFI